MNIEIQKDYTLVTTRFLLRIPNEYDIPDIFNATQYEGFNDGMLWEPPETIDELQDPLRNNIMAWESGDGYSFFHY